MNKKQEDNFIEELTRIDRKMREVRDSMYYSWSSLIRLNEEVVMLLEEVRGTQGEVAANEKN